MADAAALTESVLLANQALLDAIAAGDWKEYCALVDESVTCFEPETKGHLAHGLAFHQFFFNTPVTPAEAAAKAAAPPAARPVNTMSAPQVRLLGPTAALVAYTRLVQSRDASGAITISNYEESRVWQLVEGRWKHVHFHKSSQGQGGC